MTMKNKKFIISGGGTGGHIFPAISIGKEIKQRFPDYEILFVGAEGRMEMEKVPAAGYKIIGLPVAGIQRRLTIKNLFFPFKLYKSLRKAAKIIKDYKPSAVIGVGGYASFPVLRSASKRNIPILLQEQNSYAGLTNKILGKKADKICVAYPGMKKYFPEQKIVLTGNPVRKDLIELKDVDKSEALEHFNLKSGMQTVLILGGSLGSRTINDSTINWIEDLSRNKRVQFLWQTGKNYYKKVNSILENKKYENIVAADFIKRMDFAYAAADIIISRAGAGTISELAIVGKPAILVPSPNVAEDHQTKNAISLVGSDAAVMVSDENARAELYIKLFDLLNNEKLFESLSFNIKKFSKPYSTSEIVDELMNITK